MGELLEVLGGRASSSLSDNLKLAKSLSFPKPRFPHL